MSDSVRESIDRERVNDLLERIAELERTQRKFRRLASSSLLGVAAAVTMAAAVAVKSADLEIWPDPAPGAAGADSARVRLIGNDSGGTSRAVQFQNVTDNGTPDEYRLDVQNDAGVARMTIDDDGNVGIGSTSPGARLEIAGDGQTVLIPRKSTAGDPAGSNGMLYYNSNTNKFRMHQNGAWNDLGGAGGSGWVDDGSVVRLATAGDRVGIGTASPGASSALEVSSTTGGFIPPRMTLSQRDSLASPKAGTIVFCTTTSQLCLYDGENWIALGTLPPQSGQTPTLYALASGTNELIKVDRTSGIGALVGNTGWPGIEGLAYDRDTGILYGVANNSVALLIINKATGAGTQVGNTGFTAINGLAYDPNANKLYGADMFTDQLLVLDTGTGAATAIGALGFGLVQGLAFDPNTNTLYGVDEATSQLLTINTTTGAGTAVGPLGFGSVRGLDFDPSTNTLYGSDLTAQKLLVISTTTGAASAVGATFGFGSVNGLAVAPSPVPAALPPLFGLASGTAELIKVDRASGIGTLVGNTGWPGIDGLAYNRNTGILYGVANNSVALLIINKATGAGTQVGNTGFTAINGLAYDPNANKLYGADMFTDQLLVLDTGTGAATAIGALGFGLVQGLAFDPNTNTLYGVDEATSQLLTINTTTGAGTAVGPLGFGSVRGLDFDPSTNTLYGSDLTAQKLLVISTTTGAASAVGATFGFGSVNGLAAVPD